MLAAAALALALAGCASLAQREAPVSGPRTVEGPMTTAIDRWEDSPRVESITRYGISLSAPAGFAFEAPAGGAVLLDSVPWGILLIITNGQQTLEGSLQVVPVDGLTTEAGQPASAGGGAPPPVSALRYLESYGLVGEELSTGSTVPGALSAPVVAVPVAVRGLERHLVAGMARFPAGYADHLAVLVEIWTPRNDAALIQHAASIIASLDLPGSDAEAAVSGRSRNRGATVFRDTTGEWSWVLDTEGGFAVRRQLPASDLYVILDTPVNYEADELSAAGASLELSYGEWVWDAPLAAVADEAMATWIARLPGVSLGDQPLRQDLQLTLAVPSRGWRDGRARSLDQPPLAELLPAVQELMDGSVLLR